MKPIDDDPVIAEALEYESATLDALRLLETSTDGVAQRAACIRYARAVVVFIDLPIDDQICADSYLAKRGRVPKDASRIILAAMELMELLTDAMDGGALVR
jgi:hypothetical protein